MTPALQTFGHVPRPVISDSPMTYISIDSEGYLFVPGCRAPKPICWSWCNGTQYGLLTHSEALPYLTAWLKDDTVILSGFNMAYDMASLMAYAPHLRNWIFRAYDLGRIVCTKINEQLIDISLGQYTTKEKGRYSLSGVVYRTFDIDITEAKGKGNKLFSDKDAGFLPKLAKFQYIRGYLDGKLSAVEANVHWYGEDCYTEAFAEDLRQELLKAVKGDWDSIPWRIRYAELDGKIIAEYPELAKTYSMDDTKWDYLVGQKQRERAVALKYTESPQKHVRDSIRQAANDFALYLTTCWGFRTDWRAVAQLKDPIVKELVELNKTLESRGLLRLNTSGAYKGRYSVNESVVKQMCREAYERQGKPPPLTDSGLKASKDGTLTKDNLTKYVSISGESLLESGDELLAGVFDAELRTNVGGFANRDSLEDLLGTWVPTLESGIIIPCHTNFNALLNTGRTSSYDFNSQNPPRKGGIRECFIPRKGFYFCSVDYSAIELRTLAQVCLWLMGTNNGSGRYYQEGLSKLADAFLSGADPHCITGAHILGVSLSDFMLGLKDDKHTKKFRLNRPTPYTDARQLAKALNFGLPGGLGAEAFVAYAKASYGVILVKDAFGKMDYKASVEKAKQLKRLWLGLYPEIDRYMKLVGQLCGGHGDTYTALQYVSNRLRGDCNYTAGCNTYFQGLAADGGKHALYDVVRECHTGYDRTWEPSVLFGCRVVSFIHDEILLEVPIDRAHECAMRVGDVMCAVMQMYVPDIPILAEPAMAARWYKDMEPVWADAEGNIWDKDKADKAGVPVWLQPWAPKMAA